MVMRAASESQVRRITDFLSGIELFYKRWWLIEANAV